MWKLMTDDAITKQERIMLSRFLLSDERLTQGKRVKEFEEEWSKWLGCKYSVFVNSGSSANLMLVRAMGNQKKWAAQACTWSTTISPILQGNGTLILCDVLKEDFSPDLVELERIFKAEKTEFLFLTHLLGFNALSDELIALCDKYCVVLLEDCCEAHGATFKGKKVGTHGLGSSFSFYYGHHMTTIEGGMACTDDEELYHELLLLRSHGLLRELPAKERKLHEVPNVNPAFCFLRDGYNLRNSEMNAKLGLHQLPGLDEGIYNRNILLKLFLTNLDPTKFHTQFNTEGCSNFALPIFVKDPALMNSVCEALEDANIEYRPCIAGNLHNHPITFDMNIKYSENTAEEIHQGCIYIGNHKDVTTFDVLWVTTILNKL
jgi:CDP-6-deoxy-D-xylo-4-hexulose-3-dehydrase